ncbi:MAG TPA: hypothetical protein VNM24_06500 [Burkholderiales bacterium]|nr:hypothetical protein [Burkholderiales bacterium]
MKLARWHAIVLGGFLASSHPLARASDPAEVASPALKVGERWVYRVTTERDGRVISDRTEIEITAVDNSFVHTVTYTTKDGNERDVVYTPDWNDLVFYGGFVKPHLSILNFPLRSGNRRVSTVDLRIVRSRESAQLDVSLKLLVTAEVKSWEQLEVPAGVFRALRVSGWAVIPERKPSQDAIFARLELWYSPDVKRWVKRSWIFAKAIINEELVHFRLK